MSPFATLAARITPSRLLLRLRSGSLALRARQSGCHHVAP
ncbi:hypothetical protein THIX_10495 [Thiomonas sp. X19]|nr:hypothetical protein THIX_10495 [Thiomonas sp. X19]